MARTRVICQIEMNELIRQGGPLKGRVIFWINDLEAGQPFAAPLSMKSAWIMATHLRENFPETQVAILYDSTMPTPLGTFDRTRARELGIALIPYDNHVHPTVKNDYISYNRATDRTEQDLPWDLLVLSPRRTPGAEALKTAKILGLEVKEEAFLDRSPQMVRPDQVVLGEKLIVGSACQPCDLRGALSQGRPGGQENRGPGQEGPGRGTLRPPDYFHRGPEQVHGVHPLPGGLRLPGHPAGERPRGRSGAQCPPDGGPHALHG